MKLINRVLTFEKLIEYRPAKTLKLRGHIGSSSVNIAKKSIWIIELAGLTRRVNLRAGANTPPRINIFWGSSWVKSGLIQSFVNDQFCGAERRVNFAFVPQPGLRNKAQINDTGDVLVCVITVKLHLRNCAVS